jgi:multidrug efflux pump subunit AcrA (membrane-fusion protein)
VHFECFWEAIMKKQLCLLGVAALSLACAAGVRTYVNAIPDAVAVVIGQSSAEVQVQCKGRIEEAGAYEIYTGVPVVIGEVFVKEGDWVQKGDPIAKVNTEETVRYLSRRINQTLALAELNHALPVEWLAGQLRDDRLLPQYIRAESDGWVRQLALSRYEIHPTDTPAAIISAGGTPYVRIQVRENDASQVEVGQTVQISGTGLPVDYEGVIREIASAARNDESGDMVLDVFVDVPEQNAAFRTGLNVTVCVATETLENVIVVPHEAVQIDARCREYVMVYRDGRAEKQMVDIAQDVGTGYLVSSGLVPGDILLPDNESAGEWVRPCVAVPSGDGGL